MSPGFFSAKNHNYIFLFHCMPLGVSFHAFGEVFLLIQFDKVRHFAIVLLVSLQALLRTIYK